MTAISKLNRAIVKLESSRPFGNLPWRLSTPDIAGEYAIQQSDGQVIAFGVADRPARATVVAVNTIDAQLAILRDAIDAENVERHWDTLVYTRNALALADAILGVDE